MHSHHTKITIDPVTRIEGHLKLEAVVDGGEVKEAACSGTLFRGFEIFLRGRDPIDAVRLTQRVCGVCPTTHATASAMAVDNALGMADKVPANGRIIRNLILGSNLLQSHVLHFYALAALDFVDVTAVADYAGANPHLKAVKDFIGRSHLEPFVPRYEGDYRLSKDANRQATANYIRALEIRRLAQEMLSIFGGKMPHNVGIVPGGVTSACTVDKIVAFRGKLTEIREFIDNVYLPDVLAVAKVYADYARIGVGCKRLLAYGGFDQEAKLGDPTQRRRFLSAGRVTADLQLSPLDASKITEHVKHSWYTDDCAGAPGTAKTQPALGKADAYSWLKAPRYDGQPHEVGPLARVAVAYVGGNETVKAMVNSVLGELGVTTADIFSVLGRHAARAIECKLVADAMDGWLSELRPGEPTCAEYVVPDEGVGMGLNMGPRGANGHWIQVKGKKIENYQLVVPTTWNCSPKDANGQPGPVEQALMGAKVKDPKNPFELVRIVRSFDPCLACSVHVINAKGRELGRFRIA